MHQFTEPGLPLLVVVEGENDICFLKGMSGMLHRADPDLPDLSQLARRATDCVLAHLRQQSHRMGITARHACTNTNSTCSTANSNPKLPTAARSWNSSTRGLAALRP